MKEETKLKKGMILIAESELYILIIIRPKYLDEGPWESMMIMEDGWTYLMKGDIKKKYYRILK
jgi:hypothetical protein